MMKKIVCLICAAMLTSISMPATAKRMYAPDGRYIDVEETEIQLWKDVGWYEFPVSAMYAPDGRSIVVDKAEVQLWKNVGWYEFPVRAMYAPDGRVITVNSDEILAWQNVGWYTEPVALMQNGSERKYVLSSETELYRRSGWFTTEQYAGLYDLGTQIKQYINNKSGQFGIYIKNLKTNEYLVLNDNRYSSASIIKLFVMASLYNEIEYGSVIKDDKVQKHLRAMITVSDNYSSNFLVRTIGQGNYLNGFNEENAFSSCIGCINTQHKALFIGYGDYVSYGRNVVSPLDCGILLEKIYRGELVSTERSGEMLSLLKMQQRRNKIPYYLPDNVICANKTGETSTVQSDVGIVYSPGCDYIICVISNNAKTGINDIRQISLMTYNYFNPSV